MTCRPVRFEALVSRQVLTNALWYSDGSGAHGATGLGIEGTSDQWRLVHVELAGENVLLRFENYVVDRISGMEDVQR